MSPSGKPTRRQKHSDIASSSKKTKPAGRNKKDLMNRISNRPKRTIYCMPPAHNTDINDPNCTIFYEPTLDEYMDFITVLVKRHLKGGDTELPENLPQLSFRSTSKWALEISGGNPPFYQAIRDRITELYELTWHCAQGNKTIWESIELTRQMVTDVGDSDLTLTDCSENAEALLAEEGEEYDEDEESCLKREDVKKKKRSKYRCSNCMRTGHNRATCGMAKP